MNSIRPIGIAIGLFAVILCAATSEVQADPCGMVPPITTGDQVPIARVGDQSTYVFYKDGVETVVIRPGFQGKVEEFGMLIPFPDVPAIRKVSDNIFPHIAAAIDPPEVVVYANVFFRRNRRGGFAPQANAPNSSAALALKKDEVRVVKEEAVGMYEVAVLEAGSAAALNRWMDEHGYKYPEGMDDACNDYVDDGWCFVAVKTKVGAKSEVDPKPGMRKTNTNLPTGATFDGHVQAMGFRFRVKEPVVPMRLSTFNEGDLHNIVYFLTDGPQKIRSVPEEYVVRQIPGKQLIKNVADPLPLRVIGGKPSDLQQWQKQSLPQQRDPVPHSGAARDLFASDLLAVKEGRLSHPHEEHEKMLLRIGERLGLRGPEIDRLNEETMKEQREAIVKSSLSELDDMTLTVIDGDFPREVLANQNLSFAPYRMNSRRNDAKNYDAKTKKPAAAQQGVLYYGELSALDSPQESTEDVSRSDATQRNLPGGITLPIALSVTLLGLGIVVGRRSRRRRAAKWWGIGLVVLAILSLSAAPLVAQEESAEKEPTTIELIDQLGDPKQADVAAETLIKMGQEVVPDLIGEAIEGNNMTLRGWAIVCLAEIGGKESRQRLTEIYQDEKQPMLVRTWSAAGVVSMADSTEELLELAQLISQFPAIGRPIGLRLVAKFQEDGENVTAEDLLNATIRVPQLQQSLAPAILATGADKLVAAMVTGKDANVRRQAAAYLATLSQQGEDSVPSAIIKAYQFDPNAKDVPWTGGALFVPALKWGKEDAKSLVGQLIAWHVWSDLHPKENTKQNLKQQLHNNLRSLQLAAAAGYQSPGFQQVDTKRWLQIWGQAVGKEELEKVLKEQNAVDKYQDVLDGLN